MRLVVVVLTLGFGLCGPTLADTEKVVFVVPRYIRRSFSNNAAPFYKVRVPKRPFFVGHYAGNPGNGDRPFFPGGKQTVGQNLYHGADFGKNFAGAQQQQQHHREVQNQVIIPHGKGISHGVSFGKGYIPQEELKRAIENYAGFPRGDENQLQDSAGQGFNFEDEGYLQRFEGQSVAPQEARWVFPPSNEEGRNQEPHQVEHEQYKMFEEQGSHSPPNEQLFYTKLSEQPRPISNGVHPSARMTEHKLTPIVLQDTIDMKEYIEKVEAFTRSWPLQGLAWNNQQPNFPGLTFPHIQGVNPWAPSFPSNPSGGYQVQEESVEEPMKRSFSVAMM
ncbi:uncharacterized protein LOC124404470 [Diprion similis]|uniref:uncharacterized protein LOC124404470 n=1 Tax=Diprion similis TaxID=362088 RepID=UPI001EF92F8F|nr:uncharacterized protein LOC124404470 [Diprion similis]